MTYPSKVTPVGESLTNVTLSRFWRGEQPTGLFLCGRSVTGWLGPH